MHTLVLNTFKTHHLYLDIGNGHLSGVFWYELNVYTDKNDFSDKVFIQGLTQIKGMYARM